MRKGVCEMRSARETVGELSILEAMEKLPGPRSGHGRRRPLGAILGLSICAMLCGARSLYAISQWGRDQGQEVSEALRFTRERTLCISTLHQVFSRMDRGAFEELLGQWPQDRDLEAGEALAIDGKRLRGIHGEKLPGVNEVFSMNPSGDAFRLWHSNTP